MICKRKLLNLLLLATCILLLATVVYAETVEYVYDDAGRLIRAQYKDGETVTKIIDYYYDEVGNRAQKVVGLSIISIDPTSHDFGSVILGDSPQQHFTVVNNGTLDLAIDEILDINEFDVQNDTCSMHILTPSVTCSFDVVFTPLTAGFKNADLVVPSDDPNFADLIIPLSGKGGSYTLTVTKDGTGTGTVTSTPVGIDCGGDCDELYGTNELVALTAEVDEDTTFMGWSGGCTGTGTCDVTMSADIAVTATFDLTQPVAEFSATPLNGSRPLNVDFTDLSTGYISSWEWDFGDGTTSTEQNPSHIYDNPGTYTVALTVHNQSLVDTMTKTAYISVGTCTNDPVRVVHADSSVTYFTTLQDAYNAALNGETIQSQTLTLAGNLIMDQSRSVVFAGGYDCGYSSVIGDTKIVGNVDVINGFVDMGNFVIE